MRSLLGFVLFLFTLAGVGGGIYVGFLMKANGLGIFFCGIGGLILVGVPCHVYYSNMFPSQKCPQCGHDLSEEKDEDDE